MQNANDINKDELIFAHKDPEFKIYRDSKGRLYAQVDGKQPIHIHQFASYFVKGFEEGIAYAKCKS